jgi:hypothetical protein
MPLNRHWEKRGIPPNSCNLNKNVNATRKYNQFQKCIGYVSFQEKGNNGSKKCIVQHPQRLVLRQQMVAHCQRHLDQHHPFHSIHHFIGVIADYLRLYPLGLTIGLLIFSTRE